ncbi:MAG: alpha/beta fold hydrolase [Patescibacteria group bacterium]|nr:alpha/beta fold hydrolase [Patescibacteria group bacterium]
MEKVSLKTSDGVEIIGDYYTGLGSRGVLLLHMMPTTRVSWRGFAPKLVEHGYHALAIDLRGHGESANGPENYKSFSDKEHQASIHDVESGVQFLKEKGTVDGELVIVGASIGANLALWYASDHTEIKQIVLLSPGLNYKGIETKPLIRRLEVGQGVFFASSEDDERSNGINADMNRELHKLIPQGVEKKLVIYQAVGHGTDMFGKEKPDLESEILEWIK